MSLVTRTAEVLRTDGILRRGAHLLLAASGGCDSTVLGHVLGALRRAWDLQLTFVYVHHALRREADAEAVFVRDFATESGASFEMLRVDVPAVHAVEGGSVQDVARRLRYEALESVRARICADAILTAHHADDQAETLLGRFLRGTGVQGLAGIRPRFGRVYRPFLATTRDEIEAWASKHGLRWMQDASNDSDTYDRNRLRHHVIPAVRTHAENAWPSVMTDTARLFQSLDEFLERHISRLADDCISERGTAVVLAVPVLKGYFEFEQLSLLRRALAELRGSGGAFDEVFSLHQLISADPGKRAVLRGGVVAFREKASIVIEASAPPADPRRITVDAECTFDAATFRIERCELSTVSFHANPSEEYIDLDTAGEDFILRPWSAEDVFRPLGFDADKRVGSFLADRGIPLHRRLRIPVLEGPHGIVWICGVRLDERARIRLETERAARIEYLYQT